MTQLDLNTLQLSAGNHPSPDKGMCVMEAASMLTGGEFGDAPACVSPVIRAVGMALNDRLPDDLRQRLVPFVPLVVDTADERDDQRRAMALDWLVREFVPMHYDLLPEMAEHAAELRALPELKTPADFEALASILGAAQQTAASVQDSVQDSMQDSMRYSVWARVWDSVRDSVRDSVWGSVQGSVQDSVWDSVRYGVRYSVWARVWDGVVVAAARTGDTAHFIEQTLNPLGLKLLESLLALYRRLCLLGKPAPLMTYTDDAGKPISGNLISESDFWNFYKPIPNPLWEGEEGYYDGTMFEPSGEHLALVKQAIAEGKPVATLIDADVIDGIVVIPGYHLCNRIGYFVLTNPMPEDSEFYLWWSDASGDSCGDEYPPKVFFERAALGLPTGQDE